jgi:uncharacterized protein (TIGR02246 family)
MSARTPEDWPYDFARSLNAGDLEAVVALYEPGASVVLGPGETVVGHDGVRRMVGSMIETQTQMQCRVAAVVTVGDVALVYNDWRRTAVDPSGRTTNLGGTAIEVLRSQSDGTWKLVIGDPPGRGHA